LALAATGTAARAGEPPAAPGPQTTKLRSTVRDLLDELDAPTPGHLWTVARQLSDLGPDVEPMLAAQLEGASDLRKLVIGRALCLAGELGLGRRTLLELTRGAAAADVRICAARAAGMADDPVGLDHVADALTLILDLEEAPLVKAAVADAVLRVTAGWRSGFRAIGDDAGLGALEARARALEALRDILRGDDRAAAREAALVLGENDLETEAHPLLTEMAAEPSAEGRRASLILRGVRPPWVEILDEISRKARQAYVNPDEVDRDDLVDAAAKGMARSLDDFSDYLDESDVKSMDEMLGNEYEGIGAWVGMRDSFFTIMSPVYGGPSYRSGLRSLDRILEVDGVRTNDLGFEKSIKNLKGPKGTPVKVKVMRRGWSEPQMFTIVREAIRIDQTHSRMLPGRIGYVKLVHFSENAGVEVRAHVSALVDAGARGFIFDLRDNGGGLLSEAVSVSDVFLDPANDMRVIVSSVGRPEYAPQRNFFSTKPDAAGGRPLALLVNSGSASASEIVAGALQDWERARLIGEKTFGKGSVQSLFPLRSTGMKTKLRLTIARYYLPSQRCIDKKGIEPDIKAKDDSLAPWESEEIIRLGLQNTIAERVREAYKKEPAVLAGLADSDNKRLDAYPGMRALAEEAGTRVSDDALRSLARAAVRRLVADDRGRRFVCDLQEDKVLRRGIYEVLTQLPAADDIPATCREIMDEFKDTPPAGLTGPVPSEKTVR
jgi:carboxyl-terminal processing protease